LVSGEGGGRGDSTKFINPELHRHFDSQGDHHRDIMATHASRNIV
jgi:hypothetical protein